MERFNLPVDTAFEDGTRIGDLILSDYQQEALVFQDINWELGTDTAEDVQEATSILATEHHYANMSHLILCGEIIRFGVRTDTLDAQRAAIRLAAYKMEDANIWGRYLGKTETGFSVGDELKTYYRHLFSEDNALPVFIGMETLGCPFSIALFNTFHDVGDALYQDITDNIIKQKQEEQEFVIEALQPVVADISQDDRATISETAQDYCDLATQILARHSDRLTILDVDNQELQQAVDTAIDEFHTELGLYK